MHLQVVRRSFCELRDHQVHLGLSFFHAVDDVRSIVEISWRKDLVERICGIVLVDPSAMLNELLVGLPSHCLVKREHEVLVEFLLSLSVKHIVLLE